MSSDTAFFFGAGRGGCISILFIEEVIVKSPHWQLEKNAFESVFVRVKEKTDKFKKKIVIKKPFGYIR